VARAGARTRTGPKAMTRVLGPGLWLELGLGLGSECPDLSLGLSWAGAGVSVEAKTILLGSWLG
jgi:hypothetical protein